MAQLHRCVLDRQRDRPLDVEVTGDLSHIILIAGKPLPLLMTLHIQTSGALSKALDIFEVASRLEHIMIHGCPSIRLPPLEQMSDFSFVDMPSTEITTAVSLMSSLSLGATSCLDFHLDEWRDRSSLTLPYLEELDFDSDKDRVALRATLSFGPIHIPLLLFTLVLDNHLRPYHRQPLNDNDILASLTLPYLEELDFDSDKDPSSLDKHLRLLELEHVCITETQPLQCLSSLNSLGRLWIADHINDHARDPEPPLLTDTLL
ncbi:hypothetical protein B0H13DRAFT_2361408 [Mycena leptocephala]|nr:hypothetical protein B0H13DRAFT_2361408 [Mycena leptocephala]